MLSLPKRESLTVEFKSDPKGGLSDKAVTDAVVGLSNADGGTLYIGIEDSGKITGLRDVPDNKWNDPRKIVSFIAIHTVVISRPMYPVFAL